MCFNQPMTLAMAMFGLATSILTYYKSRNLRLAGGMFFFFTMEFLQFIQYFYINQCDNMINKVLTYVGFLHIVAQPFFTHLICSALPSQDEKDRAKRGQYALILGLCAIGGTWLFSRSVMSPWTHYPPTDTCPSTEWIRGTTVCTYTGEGMGHLSWSIPFYEQTYFVPGASIHFFLMFAPFFVMGRSMTILGLFLMLTGPFLASYLTPSLLEQASIWCFYSCVQVFIMISLYVVMHGIPIHLSIRRTRLLQAELAKKGKKGK